MCVSCVLVSVCCVSFVPRHSVGGEKGTPGNYCLRMRVIKWLLLCNTTAVTNLMGWVSVVT